MRVALVTNMNGRGLEHDATIVRTIVEQQGHKAQIVQYDRPISSRFDLAIFFEVGPQWAAKLARVNWWLPNPEWARQDLSFTFFDLVLCKTMEAARLFRPHTPRIELLGFTARDRHDDTVPRSHRFLHVPGKSILKGTSVVLHAWDEFRIGYPLTVVGEMGANLRDIPHVRRLPWLSDDELKREQNAATFHLLPSAYEGFGHCIHEALSCGAIVARTDAPPMNECPGIPIKAHPGRRMGLATLWDIDTRDIAAAVERCMAMDAASIKQSTTLSRSYYERTKDAFQRKLVQLLRGCQ